MPSVLEAGACVGPYEIVGLLGAGGMGEVYRARDTRLQRDVALKVLSEPSAGGHLERFEQEARATAALSHPNILAIHDVGVHEGRGFFVSELLEGTTLRSRLDAGPLPVGKAIDVAKQIAIGLAAAHAKGVVHRDIKPENVFLTSDGRVKVLDFGIAKIVSQEWVEAGTTDTGPAAIPGTLGYMSPEQIQGAPVDGRSDIFSLGAVMYEMVAGRRAFSGPSPTATLAAILTSDPPPLPGGPSGRPPGGVDLIVRRCLEKAPAERFQSCADLAHALDAVSSSSDHAAQQRSINDPVENRLLGLRAAVGNAKRRVVLAVLSTVLALGSCTMLLLHGRSPDSGPAAGGANDARRQLVAVLPFKNLATDPRQDYFAAGITEEIHNQLSKITALRLVGRPAAQRYGNRGFREIAAELGAGSVVEGSVRTDGDRVRVGVELVDTQNQQTLWSEEYDRPLRDVFAVQTEVAERVAAALNAKLSADERRRVEKPPTQSFAAYDLYLQSQSLRFGEREAAEKGIDLLRRAVRIDPDFAVAHAALAYRLAFVASWADKTYLDLGLQSAREAIRIDPRLADGHLALASIHLRQGKVEDARVAFVRAIDLDPNGSGAMANLSVLDAELGHYDEALAWAVRAFKLATSLSPDAYYHVALPLVEMNEDATAEQWLNAALRRFPRGSRLQLMLAVLHARQGKLDLALDQARRLVAQAPGDEESRDILAEVTYAAGTADARESALRQFERSPDLNADWWIFMHSPRLRYASLLLRRGERGRALALAREALELAEHALHDGNQSPRVPVEIAAVHAVCGRLAAALDWLERAYGAGLRDSRGLSMDPVFEPVRQERRFISLMARMDADIAVMQRRANASQTLPESPVQSSGGPVVTLNTKAQK